jgi:F-type H+-transporting ATPase subunit a
MNKIISFSRKLITLGRSPLPSSVIFSFSNWCRPILRISPIAYPRFLESPLEIFEIATFDWFGLELDENLVFVFSGFLFGILFNGFTVDEETIDAEDEEEFEFDPFGETVDSLIIDNIGDDDDDELNGIINTVFQAILVSNLSNLLPYSDSSSNYIIFTLYMAGVCFIALNFNGLLIHSFNMINLFLPQGVPTFLKPMLFVIEVISYFARLFSLGIRLFANMMSGHILVAILSTFSVILLIGLNVGFFISLLLIVVIVLIFFLETIICYLQAYVFGMLVTIYYGDAINLHHGS